MKDRITVTIADAPLVILSDEPEDFVVEVAKILDERIRTMTLKSRRSSNYDAAVLCALEYCSEKLRLEEKIKNLEHQISLYEVNDTRFREDISKLKKQNEILLGELKQLQSEENEITEEPTAAPPDEPAADEGSASDPDSITQQKLAEIEQLLRPGKGTAHKNAE